MALEFGVFKEISDELLKSLEFNETGEILLSSFEKEIKKISKRHPEISDVELYKFSSHFVNFTKKMTGKFVLSLIKSKFAA